MRLSPNSKSGFSSWWAFIAYSTTISLRLGFTTSDVLLAVNALGLIIWFVWLGIVMLRGRVTPVVA